MTPLRTKGSADADGCTASSAEASKSVHDARTGQLPFDNCWNILSTLAMESFGRLGKTGSELVDQLSTINVEGADSGNLR